MATAVIEVQPNSVGIWGQYDPFSREVELVNATTGGDGKLVLDKRTVPVSHVRAIGDYDVNDMIELSGYHHGHYVKLVSMTGRNRQRYNRDSHA